MKCTAQELICLAHLDHLLTSNPEVPFVTLSKAQADCICDAFLRNLDQECIDAFMDIDRALDGSRQAVRRKRTTRLVKEQQGK